MRDADGNTGRVFDTKPHHEGDNMDFLKTKDAKPARRKFMGAAAAVTLGAPMIAKGQTGPISMRWQSTGGSGIRCCAPGCTGRRVCTRSGW